MIRACRNIGIVAALAMGVGGCAEFGGGARSRPPEGLAAKLAVAATTHEFPSPRPPAEHAPGSPSPEQAIESFARTYINWDAGNVARRLGALARASVGQARSEMQLAAVQTAADEQIRQAGIANHGSVEAVARLGRAGERYVVVTRERTTATDTTAYEELAPAWHLTVVTVTRIAPGRRGSGGRWAISGWQPES